MADTVDINTLLGSIELTDPLHGANEGHVFRYSIPVFFLWRVYNAINTTNWADLHTVISIAGSMAQRLHNENFPDPGAALTEVWTNLAIGLSERDLLAVLEEPPKEEQVIGFTYLLLHHRRITRQEAAGLATGLLYKPIGEISADAWRLKVDRWVKERGFPPVGIRKRKKKQRT